MRDQYRDGPDVLLVGVDGSDTSLRAAAYVAGMARRQGARLGIAGHRFVGSLAVHLVRASRWPVTVVP